MGGNLVSAAHCVLRQQRERSTARPLELTVAGARCRPSTSMIPPPAGTRTVFEMTVDCRIGSAGEALFDFAHRLILGIPVVNRKLPRLSRN
jgi:hypothetical protein